MLSSTSILRFKLAFLALLLAGCQGASQGDTDKKVAGIRPPQFAEEEEVSESEVDFGENWDAVEGLLSRGPDQGSSATTPEPVKRAYSAPQVPRYGICLATFTNDDHVVSAREYIRRIGLLMPQMMEELSVHVDKDHSKVLYGDFKGWQDPTVGKVTRELRAIRIQGRPLFLTPILTEVIPPRDPRSIGPMELLSVRLTYPDIRTLYTVEVAVWGDFDSGQLSDTQRRRLAEDYARSLRQAGHQAWYDHNERKKMSTVTVGIFDHSAIDPDSGIHSEAVERVMSRFPARLVNGELLMEPVSPGDPGAGTRVQKPRMVEVPRL
ncbi:MAG: hypothetical protein VX527_02140 [Planctomycetota bacterium]|nr:hypothetical protein [Planctomycetota bacterium]